MNKLLILLFLVLAAPLGYGDYIPFNSSQLAGNVGLGTALTGGGFVVMNGNVGIGTWIPSQLLHINGPVKATAYTGGGSLITGITTGYGWTNSGTAIYPTVITNNVGIGTTAPNGAGLAVINGNVGIGTWATNGGTMVIKGGNVGIGTTAPQTLMDLYGGTHRTQASNNQGDNFIFGIPSFPTTNLWKFYPGDRGNAIDLFFASTDSSGNKTEIIKMCPSFWGLRAGLFVYGNMGIGTMLPTSRLGIVGGVAVGANVSSAQILNSVPSGSLWIQNNVGIGTLTLQSGLSVMNGNVGVGTANPTDTLYVAGNVGIGAGSSYQLYPAPANGLMVQGNLGIGTFGPSTANLEIWSGAAFSKMNAGDTTFTHSSSRQWKENIQPFFAPDILRRMAKVNVTTYDYKPDFCPEKQSCENRLGLIAEDFYPVFKRGKPNRIDGSDIQMAMWLAVQQLTKKIDMLGPKIKQAALENKRLKAQLAKIHAD